MKKLLILSLLLIGCQENYVPVTLFDSDIIDVPIYNRKVVVVRYNKRSITCYLTGADAISCIRDLDTRYPLPCLDATSHDPVGRGCDYDPIKKVCR